MPINSQISLRDYTPADFDAVHAIDQLCYTPEIAYSREDLHVYLRFPGAQCLIALDGEQIIGFCITAQRGKTGYIVTIDVLAEYRRLGAGSRLLAECETRMAAHGVHVVHLETATDNDSAVAFWQKHGYRTRSLKRGYYPGGLDAFAMTKPLEPVHRAPKVRR
ncbi:MAG TPA: N-acetyltransferase [Candidatus Acidoferrales bacterium]|nr:N-acetyltransferase [Candidatus Acidoferrales bacterium]